MLTRHARRFLTKASFEALTASDPAYGDVIRALASETEATRRKREDARRRDTGAYSRSDGSPARPRIQFVHSNANLAPITHTVRHGVNAQGRATVNAYALLQLLGSGTYGRVYLCEDSDAHPFAIKVVDKVRALRHQSREYGEWV